MEGEGDVFAAAAANAIKGGTLVSGTAAADAFVADAAVPSGMPCAGALLSSGLSAHGTLMTAHSVFIGRCTGVGHTLCGPPQAYGHAHIIISAIASFAPCVASRAQP